MEAAPATLDFDAVYRRDFERFNSSAFVPGDHFWASFTHLNGYSWPAATPLAPRSNPTPPPVANVPPPAPELPPPSKSGILF